MDESDSFELAAQPHVGVGQLLVELLCNFGFDEPAIAAMLRNFVTDFARRSVIARTLRTFIHEFKTGRSLIRAIGNTFPFPVGDIRVNLKPFITNKPVYINDETDDLWENADMVESGCGSIASDDGTSLITDLTAYSTHNDRVLQLEAEVAMLKKMMMKYCAENDNLHMAESAKQGSLTAATVDTAKIKVLPPRIPPPPAPPLPPDFNKLPKISISQNTSDTSDKSVEKKNNITDSSTNSKAKYDNIFSEMAYVRLKPVQKSPGGTPLIKKRQPTTELEMLLAQTFATIRANEEEEENNLSDKEFDDSWNAFL